MWDYLKQFWRGRSHVPRKATVYTKSGCLLCDEAVELLNNTAIR